MNGIFIRVSIRKTLTEYQTLFTIARSQIGYLNYKMDFMNGQGVYVF